MKYKFRDYMQAVGMVVTMPFYAPTSSQRAIHQMSESYSLAFAPH